MSRWNGPAGKGAMRKVLMEKRQEAEIRQAKEFIRESLHDAGYLEAVQNLDPDFDLKTAKLLKDVFELPK